MNILTATPPRKVHDPRPQPRKQNYRFLAVALMKTLNPHVRTNFRDAVTQWQAQVGGKAYQKNLGTAKMFFALRRLLLSEAFEDLKAELEPSKQEKKVLQACRVLKKKFIFFHQFFDKIEESIFSSDIRNSKNLVLGYKISSRRDCMRRLDLGRRKLEMRSGSRSARLLVAFCRLLRSARRSG